MTIAGGWEIYLLDGDWCALKGGMLISASSKNELEKKLDYLEAVWSGRKIIGTIIEE